MLHIFIAFVALLIVRLFSQTLTQGKNSDGICSVLVENLATKGVSPASVHSFLIYKSTFSKHDTAFVSHICVHFEAYIYL